MKEEDLLTLFLDSPGVSTDTRTLVPGQIYFGLRGDRFDGNQFARKALDLGASLAIVDDPELPPSDRMRKVGEVLPVLQHLTEQYRTYLGAKVVGITGSNGKTTTKELLHRVLSKRFKVHATAGNFNNHIGVPLTVLSAPRDTEVLIVELGANHPGEIADLCKVVHPDMGYITNIGHAHLEGFGEIEQVLHTKTALFRSVCDRGGKVFVNLRDEYLKGALPHCKSCTIGIGNPNTEGGGLRSSVVLDSPFLHMKITQNDTEYDCPTRLIGVYNEMNVLASIEMGVYLGIPVEEAISALKAYTPSNNRSEYKEVGRYRVVSDAYNANLSSMRAAISNFKSLRAKSKVMVLGDMLELGSEEIAAHREIADTAHTSGVPALFYGPRFESVDLRGQKHFMHIGDLTRYLNKLTGDPLWILLKGSRGMRLERVLEQLE